jgi:hypothetical protein
MEEFDKIWLLHHTTVWKHNFGLFLSLWLCPDCLFSLEGTIGSTIFQFGYKIKGILQVIDSLVPVSIDDVLLLILVCFLVF